MCLENDKQKHIQVWWCSSAGGLAQSLGFHPQYHINYVWWCIPTTPALGDGGRRIRSLRSSWITRMRVWGHLVLNETVLKQHSLLVYSSELQMSQEGQTVAYTHIKILHSNKSEWTRVVCPKFWLKGARHTEFQFVILIQQNFRKRQRI